MRTPVASLRVQSSYHFGNLIQQGLRIKLRKAELDFRGQPKFPLWGFGGEQLGVTVKWYFPKWEAPLYRIEAAFALRWR